MERQDEKDTSIAVRRTGVQPGFYPARVPARRLPSLTAIVPMLRSAFFVFISGWLIWFWIDKPPAGQFRLPQASDNLVENFQRSFDILKAGHPEMAYVYIWNAHYLVLSLIGGILLAIAYSGITGHLSRRRMRKHFVPPPRREKTASEEGQPPEQKSTPAE